MTNNLLLIGGIAALGFALTAGTSVGTLITESSAGKQIKLEAKEVGLKNIGDYCTRDSECSSNLTRPGPGGESIGSGVCCDQNVCRLKRQGGLGIEWKPSEQPSLPQPELEKKLLEKAGRTDLIKTYETAGIGQHCNVKWNCSSTGISGDAPSQIGDNNPECCNNKCVFPRKDWLGTYYCPGECVGKLFGTKGSCEKSEPEKQYERKLVEKQSKRSVVI